MELKEAAKRILWHAKLLVVFVGLGLLIPLVFLPNHPSYVASTRLVVMGPTDKDHAASAADSVSAIATSESQIGIVFQDQGFDLNPASFVDRISATPVGTSGVVQLSVTSTRRFAATLANALTGRVVTVMRGSGVASYPLPHVIQYASASTARSVTTTRTQVIFLGGLAGLILGVLAAALLEALSPTVIGKEAIEKEFGAPVLAVLPGPPGTDGVADLSWVSDGVADLSWVRWQLGARAKRNDVETVELTTAGPRVDLLSLSELLAPVAAPGIRSSGLKIRTLDPNGSVGAYSPNGSAGLVVVIPTTIKKAEMDRAKDLMEVTGWPTVGLIAYKAKGRRRA